MLLMNRFIRTMNSFVAQYDQIAQRRGSEATALMERAADCAGRDPLRAAELRTAALACLGVVR